MLPSAAILPYLIGSAGLGAFVMWLLTRRDHEATARALIKVMAVLRRARGEVADERAAHDATLTLRDRALRQCHDWFGDDHWMKEPANREIAQAYIIDVQGIGTDERMRLNALMKGDNHGDEHR